jgi:hypothetical protein
MSLGSLTISSTSFETSNIASRITKSVLFFDFEFYGLVFINQVIFTICKGIPNS